MEEDKKFYSTRDIYLASALITLKFFMAKIDYQIEGEKRLPVGYFSFENTPELQETEKKYWQGMISVEPRSFVTNLWSLKAQVANVYKNPSNEFGVPKK